MKHLLYYRLWGGGFSPKLVQNLRIVQENPPTGICQRQIPSSSSFIIILFFIVRCQEWDGGHVFVLCSDASNDTESMNLAVYARAATLLDCNLNVPVILWKLRHLITAMQENRLYNNRNGKATNLSAVIKE